jgi:hypothetical protein
MSRRPCVFTHHQFEAIRDVKFIQQVMAKLNLKGLLFDTHCSVSFVYKRPCVS